MDWLRLRLGPLTGKISSAGGVLGCSGTVCGVRQRVCVCVCVCGAFSPFSAAANWKRAPGEWCSPSGARKIFLLRNRGGGGRKEKKKTEPYP